MINRRASWLITLILILMMATPVMALNDAEEAHVYADDSETDALILSNDSDDESVMTISPSESTITDIRSHEYENSDDVNEEASEKDKTDADIEADTDYSLPDPADTETDDAGSSGNIVRFDHETNPNEADNAEDVEADDKTENTIVTDTDVTLVSIGGGSLEVSENGIIECDADTGWELVSITADHDAGEIKAGREISEYIIGTTKFSPETVVTAVFRKEGYESDWERPASATAVFGHMNEGSEPVYPSADESINTDSSFIRIRPGQENSDE